MNTKESIQDAIKRFVESVPQPNLESESAQQMLTEWICNSILDDRSGTYNRDQLNFFTEFDGEEHK
jgi:hypothetical protein